MRFAESDHELKETEYIGVLSEPIPIKPSRLVVLIVRVVIPALRMQEFIASREHRYPIRQHQQATEIFRLAFSQSNHFGSNAVIAFPTAIPAEIVSRPVGIILPVRVVVRFIV
jgi:hypothetical protein